MEYDEKSHVWNVLPEGSILSIRNILQCVSIKGLNSVGYHNSYNLTSGNPARR